MTSIRDFRRALLREMQRYSKVTSEKVEQAAKDVAKMSVSELKSKSPKSEGRTRSGQYAKGWASKKSKDGSQTVHNKTDYQLTHLLEKGHVTRDGTSRTRPQKHIEPVEQMAIREFEERIERAARG